MSEDPEHHTSLGARSITKVQSTTTRTGCQEKMAQPLIAPQASSPRRTIQIKFPPTREWPGKSATRCPKGSPVSCCRWRRPDNPQTIHGNQSRRNARTYQFRTITLSKRAGVLRSMERATPMDGITSRVKSVDTPKLSTSINLISYNSPRSNRLS